MSSRTCAIDSREPAITNPFQGQPRAPLRAPVRRVPVREPPRARRAHHVRTLQPVLAVRAGGHRR